MDRLNDSLQREITLLKNDMQDFKSRQYSGVGNVVSYQTETNNTWDVDWTVSGVPSGWYRQLDIDITFTADTYSGSFVGFEVEALVNGQQYWSHLTTMEILQRSFAQNEGNFELAKRKTTLMLSALSETNGDNLKLKFKCNSIDTGTLNVTTVLH